MVILKVGWPFFMRIIKKNFLRICLIFFLLLILVYVTNITAIPDSIVLFKGEELNLGVILGVSLKENNDEVEAIETSVAINNESKVEKKNVKVSLFNLINIKDVKTNTSKKNKASLSSLCDLLLIW